MTIADAGRGGPPPGPAVPGMPADPSVGAPPSGAASVPVAGDLSGGAFVPDAVDLPDDLLRSLLRPLGLAGDASHGHAAPAGPSQGVDASFADRLLREALGPLAMASAAAPPDAATLPALPATAPVPADFATAPLARLADPMLERALGMGGPAIGRYGDRQPTGGIAPPDPAPIQGPFDGPADARRPLPAPDPGTGGFSVAELQAIRADFPILSQRVNGHPLAWLDNAATTHKPVQVIDAIGRFYRNDNSNVHRGAHTLAARATDAYEGARTTVQRLLRAKSAREIVFVRGTTEAINLVAQSFGGSTLSAGDEVLVTTLEHHANIVPWQMVCRQRGATLRAIPILDNGEVDLAAYARMLGPRTRIVGLSQVSNVLGTVVPVREMTAMAHAVGARVLVDGAQSVAHMPVDVCALGCDFFVFSGHKIFGPTGVGALYGRMDLLEAMPPWQGGGNMIDRVRFEETTYAPVPAKFEAGTGILADAVGLGAAIDYVQAVGLERIARHEHALLDHAMRGLEGMPGLRLYGTAPGKAAVAAFLIEGIEPERVGRALDRCGIAVRVGHHCAQPTMDRFGVRGMVRPSFAFYNTHDEVDRLLKAVAALIAAR